MKAGEFMSTSGKFKGLWLGRTLLGSLSLLVTGQVLAGLTDLANSPLETSTSVQVKPNIFYVLDDSGSMLWDFLPDWVNQGGLAASGGDVLVRNSSYNGVYYDPAVTYVPPLYYDGSSYKSQTSGNTSVWTSVAYDGFGTQKASNQYSSPAAYTSLLTSTTAGTTQNLTSNAYYYTFVPGEYCDALNLKNCNTQSAASSQYPYPARLRWCNTSAQTDCQASYIDSSNAPKKYQSVRYPGQLLSAGVNAVSATGKITFTISDTKSYYVSGVTVNGTQIMSGTTASTSSATTLASYVVTAINSCTSAQTGNCTATGYSATYSGGAVTITAPSSLGAISYSLSATTGSTNSGTKISYTTSSFGGGVTGVAAVYVPGSSVLTTITSTVASYPYPGTAAKASSRTDCAGTTCTYAEEMTNYANWWAYYRTRMQMTKSAASLAFSVLGTNYRLGYMSINNNNGSSSPDFLNIADITTGAGGQKQQWYQKFMAAVPQNGTGLRVALSTAGRMYAGKVTGSQKLWANESSGDTTAVSVNDPMQYACQRNYTIVSTDGYWNDSDPTSKNANGIVQIDGSTAIGDQDGSEVRPYLDGSTPATTNTLADVAEYYYKTDIRDAKFSNTVQVGTTNDVSSNNVADGQQRMYTYTVGLGASGFMLYQSNYTTAKSGDYYDVLNGTATSNSTQSAGTCNWQNSGNCAWPKPVSNTQTTIDDLWHTAVNGRGTYYSAANSTALKTGLSNFLQAVTAATGNAAAATTSNPNTTSGDNYIFQSTFRSVNWYGELARYTIDLTTGVQSTNADWSESGTVYANASTQSYTTATLDNTAYTSRSIYTYDPTNSTSSLISFTWGAMNSTMQGYFKIVGGGISGLSQLCASGTTCLPSSAQVDSATAGTNTGAGGVNLVNFLRGDRSNEGPDATTYYYQRTHVLGDIVDSQAVYVKAPMFNYVDSGYSTFKSTNASRQGMVYVGANDGMMHAFNATSGAEVWAYIPSMLLPNLYKLADKNYSTNHTFFVNATPQQGDVYFGSAWHTILVGGLGAGGRGFYALDVTTPTSPKVLWEFTSDTSKGTGYTTDADLGYSYGTPVITKLSDGTWAVIVTAGYNNACPGSGHGILWVLNAQTGAIIKKIDTNVGIGGVGVGSLCTTALASPAGLARVIGYTDTASTNNTAPRIYGGDLLGNVWRFDISALTASGGTATFQLLATLKDASSNAQPVTARPQVGNINGKVVVYVGTGQYLGVSDISTTGVQSIYAIKDPLTTSTASGGLYGSPRGTACSSTVSTNCFVKQTYTDASGVRTATSTVSFSPNFNTMNGWFADLPTSGERANTDPALQLGTLLFTTNIPSTASACSPGGSSNVIEVDYRTGLAVNGATNIGGLLSSGGVTALASAPTLVRLPNGKVVAIINLSNGTSITLPVPVSATSSTTRRVSWRELITGQ